MKFRLLHRNGLCFTMAHLDETLLLDDQEFDVTDIIKLQVDLENVHMGSRLRQLGLHFVPRV